MKQQVSPGWRYDGVNRYCRENDVNDIGDFLWLAKLTSVAGMCLMLGKSVELPALHRETKTRGACEEVRGRETPFWNEFRRPPLSTKLAGFRRCPIAETGDGIRASD